MKAQDGEIPDNKILQTFNKSVILDLESFLIKYISADGGKK